MSNGALRRHGPTLLTLALALGPAPARAWTPATQEVIAREAARLAPPDLARQIEKHERDLDSGAAAPFGDGDPLRHFKNPDGTGSLDRVIAGEVARAIAAIEGHRPFEEIVRQLGIVSHYVADANNPLNASAADPAEETYFADYLLYAESALPRFPLIFYGLEPALDAQRRTGGRDRRPGDGRDPGASGGVEALVGRSLARGRQLYPLVGQEYRRVNLLPGVEAFDDRSTAFGVASLAFSHAVNDVALVMRHIWIEAGGADPRANIPDRGERLFLLPRATLRSR